MEVLAVLCKLFCWMIGLVAFFSAILSINCSKKDTFPVLYCGGVVAMEVEFVDVCFGKMIKAVLQQAINNKKKDKTDMRFCFISVDFEK